MAWRSKWELLELPFHGSRFTWSSNRMNEECILERSDRGYSTSQWKNLYPEASIVNLPILVSDHAPILLDTQPATNKKCRTLKVDAWCLDFQQVAEIIKKGWNTSMDGSPMYSCSRKLQQIKYSLAGWCREFKLTHNIIWDDINQRCLNNQESLESMDDIEESNIRRNEGLQEAVIMLAYWKQRAKGKWLALGDSNTSFFYKSAKARKVKNEIRFIQDRCGNWIADQAQIGRELEDYFKELFHANDQHNVKLDIPVELGDLPIRLTASQKDILNKPFSELEVRDAVFHMGGLKAPGV